MYTLGETLVSEERVLGGNCPIYDPFMFESRVEGRAFIVANIEFRSTGSK